MVNHSKNSEVPVASVPNDARINRLRDQFKSEFNDEASFFVRVPGRVNIIGEHIDYCGYPVLPMALEQDILVAARMITEPEIYLRNTNEKYKSFNISLKSYEDLDIKPDSSGKPYWYNYVLCGIKGALEYLNNEMVNGLELLIDGNIPPASGLSSSSALVSAACLSFLFAQNVNLKKTDIASLCARSERYIGTQGGGMDQAIAFLAEKYSAQYITWQPLNASAVALPEDATFVVAHSLAEANKAATNDFNRRVMECRLAAKIIATLAGASMDKKIITLSQIQKNLGNNLNEMIDLVSKHLPNNTYTKHEICNILDVSEAELDELYLSDNTRHIKEFKLKQRALHVYEEAIRVEEFRKICTKSLLNGKSETNGTNGTSHQTNGHTHSDDTLEVLGNLMYRSHESLKELYECSHDNLDKLVHISKEMDVNSRLTGAGWGGCIVALCPKDKVDKYIETLINEFYEKHCNIDKNKACKYVFATKPNHGAIIYSNKCSAAVN